MIRVALLLLLFLGAAQAQASPAADHLEAPEGLHRAAAAGDVESIERFRDAGADPHARDPLGRTPLHLAVSAGHREATLTLVRRGADPQAYDDQHTDALTIAAAKGDRDMVSLLLWLGADPAAVTGPDDRTALIAAARGGHDDVVRELTAAGAPVNYVSGLGWTALMEAVIFGDAGARTVATVQALLQAGAKAAFADWQGTTPLRLARQRGLEELAALLIASGAN
ncbi:MAG TPA: ankyrin repeat domain-containing protein [Alphaproteobacteria bacterium]|nr:ankyrin repeat domain-containing protein [Alphaproteobacteria bacterium]